MPRACGLVPPPAGSRRRVTRTHGGPGPGGRAQEPAPGWRSPRAGMRARDGSVPRRAGQENAVRITVSRPCRRNGPGPRKRGVHEHGSAPRLPSPASRSAAPPTDPAPPRDTAAHGPRTASRTRAGHERDAPTGRRCWAVGAAAYRGSTGAGVRVGSGPGSWLGARGPFRLRVGSRHVVRPGGTAPPRARARTCAGTGLHARFRRRFPAGVRARSVRVPFGVRGRSGVRVPFGVRVRSGVRVRFGVRVPSGVRVRSGVRARFGVRIRSGVRVAFGVRIPSGVRVRSGVRVPSGV